MILAFTGAGISKDSGIDTFMERPDVRDCLHRHYANTYPEEYRQVIKELKKQIDKAKPNDAHLALREYNIDIITMNIDGLHQKAGSSPLWLHGELPANNELVYSDKLQGKPVLYGDMAPNYGLAIEKVSALTNTDVFLVVGVSKSTAISGQLVAIAQYQQAEIIIINENAKVNVRKTLEKLKEENKC